MQKEKYYYVKISSKISQVNENELYAKLGKRIKKLRQNANLTQEKLAEKSGISLDYLGKIEVNINKPGLKTLIKVANALDISIKALFDFD